MNAALTLAQRPQALLLDAGDTLCFLDPEAVSAALAEAGEAVSAVAIGAALHCAKRSYQQRLLQGDSHQSGWDALMVKLLQLSGLEPARVEALLPHLRRAHLDFYFWRKVPESVPLALERARAAGVRLGVISNADGRMKALIERCGLREYFEFVVDSDRVGVAKPAAGIFHEGCRRMGLPPATCLYVGDLYPVDYLGAREAGLEAVVLDPLEIHGNRAPSISSLSELPAYLSARGHPAGVG